MTLDEIRKRINTIDFEILKLLNSRMEFALRTKTLKSSVSDPKRENEVIEYIRRHSKGLIEPEFCENLFQEVIKESKRLQKEKVALLGFQGEHGSFSEVAARQFNPDLMYISCADFGEVFQGVEEGLFDYGIVPAESTIGGAMTDVNELLVRSNLRAVAEVKLPIRYTLMTLPETDPRDLRVAYSHRQAISQCQKIIRKLGLEPRPFHDMAAAAKMLVQERPEGSAVIASRFCSEFYHLQLVQDGIEDHKGHVTRFFVLSRSAAPAGGNKCSIIFVAEHRAGALFRILQEFADAGINLSRIESMPNRETPGNYVFFLDFDGSDQDPRIQEVLSRVEGKTEMFKKLGCYPCADSGQVPPAGSGGGTQ